MRVTQGGSGRLGLESADGKSILYQPRMSDSPLLMVPLSGGPARQLVNCVNGGSFTVGTQGVYYVECGADFTISVTAAIHIMNPATGQDGSLAELRGLRPFMASASRYRQTAQQSSTTRS